MNGEGYLVICPHASPDTDCADPFGAVVFKPALQAQEQSSGNKVNHQITGRRIMSSLSNLLLPPISLLLFRHPRLSEADLTSRVKDISIDLLRWLQI